MFLKAVSLFLQQSLQRSHHESSLASVKEDEDDCVDSPPNLPRDEPAPPSTTPAGIERCSTPTVPTTTLTNATVSPLSSESQSEPVTPDKRSETPPNSPSTTTEEADTMSASTSVPTTKGEQNRENRQIDDETAPTSSPISQSRYISQIFFFQVSLVKFLIVFILYSLLTRQVRFIIGKNVYFSHKKKHEKII